MALPENKAYIKRISVGKLHSHMISKFIHQCGGYNRVSACAPLGTVTRMSMCKGPGVDDKRVMTSGTNGECPKYQELDVQHCYYVDIY